MNLRRTFYAIAPWLAPLAACLLLAGCPNSFSEFANKNSDEALLFQAQLYADSRDWDNAILMVSRMTTAGQANRGTKYFLASAYAGRCGFDLLELADAVTNMGSTLLWPTLLSEYKASNAADLTDCQTAEDKIFSISTTYTDLTNDENVLLGLMQFAKMGAVLGSNSLVDAANDGTYDSGTFAPCAAGDITDAEVGEMGTGLTIAYQAFSASGSTLSSSMSGMSTICGTLNCDAQSPSDFNAIELKAIRSLFLSNELGFNTCGGALGSSLACICP